MLTKKQKNVLSFLLVIVGAFTFSKIGLAQKLENPLGVTDVPTLIGRVIKAILGIVGSLSLLMFIYGGFIWMMSGGNEEKITQGKKTLLWATLGIVIIFSSYSILNWIFTAIQG